MAILISPVRTHVVGAFLHAEQNCFEHVIKRAIIEKERSKMSEFNLEYRRTCLRFGLWLKIELLKMREHRIEHAPHTHPPSFW